MSKEERWRNPQYWNYRSLQSGRRAILARLTRQEWAAHFAIMRIISGRAA